VMNIGVSANTGHRKQLQLSSRDREC